MAIITGTNFNDVLTDEPGFARIAPATKPGGITPPPQPVLGYDDTINALDGDDIVSIHAGNDTVYGGNGADIVYDRGSGNDIVHGGAGNDVVHGGTGNDIVNGGAGVDIVYDGGAGNDTFNGGDDGDAFFAGLGNDVFDGGAGIDTVSYADRDALVSLDLTTGFALAEGIDRLVSVENATGGRYDDTLLGSTAANALYGGEGEDRMDGRAGNDRLDGESGDDILLGGEGRDVLIGGYGDDTLDGGHDGLPGPAGYADDFLWGGEGNDRMTGGAGADKFLFSAGDIDDYDTITDFQRGVDKIDLSAIDARPDLAGNQAFTFDASPDGWTEERLDGLNDWGAWVISGTGPIINGDTGEIEYRHEDGKTYVYLSTADHPNGAGIVLEGTVSLTASDFVL